MTEVIHIRLDDTNYQVFTEEEQEKLKVSFQYIVSLLDNNMSQRRDSLKQQLESLCR